ncbi:hypothetical protein HDU87_005193 [Geranomyces variabilis]|uniref:Homeobox domain-containing protein n=1 Tax=Geranomyces variabilis TaxID=109894 RepID=A0AAD5XLZ2_9FUNG|nr:hypothetical protein HDU87_005193 [Geranomyces variabilis]
MSDQQQQQQQQAQQQQAPAPPRPARRERAPPLPLLSLGPTYAQPDPHSPHLLYSPAGSVDYGQTPLVGSPAIDYTAYAHPVYQQHQHHQLQLQQQQQLQHYGHAHLRPPASAPVGGLVPSLDYFSSHTATAPFSTQQHQHQHQQQQQQQQQPVKKKKPQKPRAAPPAALQTLSAAQANPSQARSSRRRDSKACALSAPPTAAPQLPIPDSQRKKPVELIFTTVETPASIKASIDEKNEPRKRRSRTSSSTLWLLQEAFDRDPMPTAEQRAQLAEAAGMSVRNVQVWFQNRRAKTKLDTRRGSAASTEAPVSAFVEIEPPVKTQVAPIATIVEEGSELQTPTSSAAPAAPAVAKAAEVPMAPPILTRHTSIDYGDYMVGHGYVPPSPSLPRRGSLLRSPDAPPALQPGYSSGTRVHPYFPSRMVSRRHSVFESRAPSTSHARYASAPNSRPHLYNHLPQAMSPVLPPSPLSNCSIAAPNRPIVGGGGVAPVAASSFVLNRETFTTFVDENQQSYVFGGPSQSHELASIANMACGNVSQPGPYVKTEAMLAPSSLSSDSDIDWIKMESDPEDVVGGWVKPVATTVADWAQHQPQLHPLQHHNHVQDMSNVLDYEHAIYNTADSLQQLTITSPLDLVQHSAATVPIEQYVHHPHDAYLAGLIHSADEYHDPQSYMHFYDQHRPQQQNHLIHQQHPTPLLDINGLPLSAQSLGQTVCDSQQHQSAQAHYTTPESLTVEPSSVAATTPVASTTTSPRSTTPRDSTSGHNHENQQQQQTQHFQQPHLNNVAHHQQQLPVQGFPYQSHIPLTPPQTQQLEEVPLVVDGKQPYHYLDAVVSQHHQQQQQQNHHHHLLQHQHDQHMHGIKSIIGNSNSQSLAIPAALRGHKRTNSWLRRSMSSPDIFADMNAL